MITIPKETIDSIRQCADRGRTEVLTHPLDARKEFDAIIDICKEILNSSVQSPALMSKTTRELLDLKQKLNSKGSSNPWELRDQ